MDALLALVRDAGLGGARLHGQPVPARPFAGELLHAGGGLLAFLVAALGVEPGAWALGLVLLSAGARCLGLPSAASLLPRRPGWALVLRPRGPRTTRVVAAALDRPRAVPALPWLALCFQGVALLALLGGQTPRVAAVVGLVLVGGWAYVAGRPPRPDPAGAEAEAARGVLALARRAAEHGDDTTAIAFTSAGNADACGILALLDWWGLAPARTSVSLALASPGAVAALTRNGWSVSVIDDAPRSPS
jgi:hypothetical protein